MKVTGTLHVAPTDLPKFLKATTDEERIKIAFMHFHNYDMSDYWVTVGTAEVTVSFEALGHLKDLEVLRVDKELEKLTAKYNAKFNSLSDYRSTLLCLEAPKEV